MKYFFNNYELDISSQELKKNDNQVKVEPQVFDLLVYMIEKRGKLIDHQELIESIWKGRIVSYSAIAARISAARKAVGDSGKDQLVIKTVPRKGFKFLPTVETTQSKEEINNSKSESHSSEKNKNYLDHQDIHYC